MKKHYRYHPACRIFPMLEKNELAELAEHIQQHGLKDTITTLKGEILDGKNRLAACELAGVEPRFEEWTGAGSPVEWVIGQNLRRRHLSASQRAVIALEILPMLEAEAKQRQQRSRGRGKKVAHLCANSNGKASQLAAKTARVGSRYVEMAKALKKSAPKLIERVKSGELTLSEAKRHAESVPIARRSSDPFVFRGGTPTNPRDNTITTPPGICQFLYDLVSPKYKVTTILDPSAGSGALTRPWKGTKAVAFEINRGTDFLRSPDHIDCDLVLCNPPFNNSNGERTFLPQLFLERIVAVVPARTPIVFFAPMAMRLDQGTNSARWRWMRDQCPPITSIVTLPHDVFGSVKVHSEILLFNMPKLKPHYFIPDEYLR